MENIGMQNATEKLDVAGVVDAARGAGVELWVEGRRLRFRSITGELPDTLREQLRSRRDELIAHLRAAAASSITIGPVGANQRGLWFLHRLVPDTCAYNVAFAARVHGAVDTVALGDALQALVDRHEALRASYPERDGEPVRTLHGYRPVAFEIRDAATLTEQQLQETVAADYATPFDLAGGPLFRAVLYTRSADESVLLLVAHHLAVDGTSLFVLLDELFAIYDSGVTGTPVQLRSVATQYSDFIAWQSDMLRADDHEAGFWAQQLDPQSPLLELPIDHPRPRMPALRGASVRDTLSSELGQRVARFSREAGVTDFVTLLSVWYAFLSRLTGQDDVSVGTPVHGRASVRFERTVGDLINMVPLRVRNIRSLSFRELLSHTRKVVMDALAHQDYPLPLMVERLGHDGDHIGAPFQSLFVLQDFGQFGNIESLFLADAAQRFRFGSLELSNFPLNQQEGQFDVSLEACRQDDNIVCIWKYDTQLFEPATIRRWTTAYQTLLAAALERPDVPVAELRLLSDADLALRTEWNATERNYDLDTTLHALIGAQAARTPDAIAVSSRESGVVSHLTFRELDRRANALAVRLQQLGAGRDTPVAVSMERSAELVVALLAVLKAGGAYVPIDPGYPAERRSFMLDDCGALVLLTQSALSDTITSADRNSTAVIESDAISIRAMCVDAIWDELDIDAQPEERADAGDLAYIIYTSGSTGRPKGAMIEHRSIVNRLLWMQEHFELTAADVVLQKTPYSFDVSVWEFFWPLMTGARLVMAKPEGHKDPAYLASLIRTEGVSTLHFVPSMLNAFLETVSGPELPSLGRVICSGEALSSAVRDRFFRAFPYIELTNLYGPTEAAVDVSWYRCTAKDQGSTVPIGWPVANTQLHILNEQMQPVPTGVPGELYIGGVQVGRGYLNRPELTTERFVADPFTANGRLYRTGDKARFLNDGALEFLGRLDHQVKVRGFRIELGEIEARLREHPDVRDVVVVAKDERLIAYAVSDAAADDLRSWIGATLPDYMVPSVFVGLEALPLSPNGKVDRKALPEASVHGGNDRVPPRDADEHAVAAIWSGVLDVGDIGVTDNFFVLGGHSLAAARVVARISAAFDVQIPLRQFFDDPTVAAMAAWIRSHRGTATIIPMMRRTTEAGPAPLSFTQERLWFLQNFAPDSAAYNLSTALLLEGPLDSERLVDAIQIVVQRHEALRTSFRVVADRPVIVVDPESRCEIVLDDLTTLQAEQPLERARSQISKWMERPYRLDEGPLLRIRLIRVAPHRYVFGVGMHHAISDQWSFGILLDEIATLYHANNDRSVLRELPFQYGDFAAWQHEWLAMPAMQEKVRYWKERLAGLDALNLPTDRPYPRIATSSGALIQAEFSPDLARGIEALSRELGVTPFVVMLSAYFVLLHAYSRQTDFAIGAPIATRPHPDLEQLIGSFLNVLVYRTDLSADPSFREVVDRVRETAMGAASHQDVPFETVVQALDVKRDPSRPPLVQVLFNLANAPISADLFKGLHAEIMNLDRSAAQFELSLHVHERNLYLEYNTDLFDHGTARRLLSEYRRTLDLVISNPSSTLHTLTSASASDRETLAAWNATERNYDLDSTLHALVEAQVARTPDAIAVWSPEAGAAVELTFRELNRRANALAVRLQNLGVGCDAPVAVSMERSAELVVALLAVLKAGGAYVPIDPGYPAERKAFMLEDCGASVVLTQSAIGTSIPGIAAVSVDAIWDELDIDVQPEERADESSLAYIIYTSGSTGRPKGAMIEHRSIVNRLLWMQEHFELTGTDVVLQKTPYSFDVSVWEFFWPLMTGARLVMAKPEGHKDPAYLASLIRTEGVSTLHFVPSMLNAFLETVHGPELPSLKRVICSGEALSATVRDRLFRSFPHVELTNLYGPTEAAVDVSWYRCTADDRGTTVPIGWPVANTQLHILDERRQPAPIGVPGELYIGGVQVGRGYLNRPELTAERFVANPFTASGRLYRTGDKARFLNDGAIEFLGRLDHQVKVRGFRIELGEIEARLREHPDVRDVVVVAKDERLIGYVVSHTAVDDLRTWLGATLPDYMVPSVFVTLDALPLSPNGKVDRKALPEPSSTMYAGSAFEPPVGPTEQVLAQIWAELLGVEKVGRRDNFFTLGGHSLLAVRLVERMRRQQLHADIPVLFTASTLADLAAAVGGSVTDAHVPPNGIPSDCDAIRPAMLTLTKLTQAQIDTIIQQVPGGARNVQDIYPLAPLQEGILFHHMLETEADPYLSTSVASFETRERLDAFLQAVQAVVDRQDILRTAVVWEGLPEPHQVVWRSARLPVQEVVLDPAAGDIAHQLQERFDPAHWRLDVRQAPMLQFCVAEDSEHNRWLCLLLLHHLAGDHMTLEVMLEEVRAFLRGAGDALPEPLPFRNFVAQTRSTASQTKHQEFFRELLGDVNEPTAPYGLMDVQGAGRDLVEAHQDVDPDVGVKLREQARRLGVSAASVCHVAWSQVLARIAGREDVVFGTVVFGRMAGGTGADRVMGPFINTLPLRIRIDGTSAAESVQHAHRLLAELMRHEHASLALAQQCSQVRAPAPLFSALLNFRHSTTEATTNAVGVWDEVPSNYLVERTNYPLMVSVDDLGADFRVTVQVQKFVDPMRVCALLHTAFERLVDALEQSPEQPICDIDVLPDVEWAELTRWNATHRAYDLDTSLHALVEAQAARAPNATAVDSPTGSFTYGELIEYAHRVTAALGQAGVKQGDRVAILMQRSREMVGALLGIVGAGAAYVPVDPTYPDARVRYMLEDSGAVAIITHRSLAQEYTISVPILDLDRWSPPEPVPFARTVGNGTAYLIYTSGSTGKPKAVEIPHGAVTNLLLSMQERPGLTSSDVLLAVTTISFDIAVLELYLPLITGARLVIAGEDEVVDGQRLIRKLDEAGITVMQATPATWKLLITAGWEGRHGLRVLCGGEALARTLADALLDRAAEVWNMYGPTETTVWSTLDRVERDAPIMIGRPIANTTLYVLNEHYTPVPIGVAGELYIGGAGLADGYVNRADLTAERFLASPFKPGERIYRTGDLVRYRADGRIEHFGRLDHQVKVRGFRIELGEVEARLREHPIVRDAVVVARDDQLVAYVVSAATDELRGWVAEALPEYMVPSFFVPLDSLPLTPNGKVDRKALPEPTLTTSIGDAAGPRNAEEEAIAQIWRDALGYEQIGINDDFYMLGGNSLSATQVVSRIREMFEIDLPLRHFLEHPTIAEAASWIRDNRAHGLRLSPLRAQDNLPAEVPLSFAQERMWLIQKLAPESTAYNVGGAVLLEGTLDVERFRKAVDNVARRHEGMRTHFPTHGGVPVQALTADGYEFRFIDLELVPEAERQEEAEAHALELVEAPYDLENGPLARFLIARIAPDRHILAAGMHHIVSDLWSFGVLGRDIATAYANPDVQLPPLPVNYRDFSVWQRRWLREELIKVQVEYWRQRLIGVPVLELPTDFQRPPFYTFNGAVVHAPISPELRSAIEKFSSGSKATPFMFSLAVFNALLSSYSGQTDISVGVPIANRTQTATEHMIGTFVNTLIHRNDTSGNPNIRDLLQRVRVTALDAYANQDVPFDLLVKELQPPRDPSRPPLFQVLFNGANADLAGGEVDGLTRTVIPLPRRTAQFDLTVDVLLNALESSIKIWYNTALFTQDTAERLLAQYIEMLHRAVANPDIRLSELQRVGDTERKLLLENWNATQHDYPAKARLTTLFAATTQRDPARIAVESATGSFTYGELLDYAQRVTAALQQLGVGPGDRVAILMQRSREMLGALLGILGAGAAYVPVDPNYPEARVRYMLEDSGAVAVVTHRSLEREYQIRVNILDLDRWTPPQPVPFVPTAHDDAAYLIYTSGSTGKPKGVEVPHGAVANFLLSMQERPGFKRDDALLAVTTISFDIAVLELYLPLITGARVVIAGEDEALDGRRLMQRMADANITVMQATPATWKLLLAAGWEGKRDLRVLCGGEGLPRALADALLVRTAELWNMYGPTETTVWSTVDRIERDAPILIGRPIANTTLYVLREDLEPVPVGVPGELYIGGAGVATGYVNRPDLTAARFVADPFRPGERMYRTGDLVRYRADGRVEHLGRLDHQVKVRGFRIELGEIESALRAHGSIRDVAVSAVDDRLVAYIVAQPGALPPAGELRRLLSASLPQYMLPSVFVPLDELPLTPNGKIDRKRLPAPAPEARKTARRKLPSRPAERMIAEIWATLLELQEIGVNDNFFELGGHSLLAMQAVAQIEERTDVRIAPRLLFFRTLGELADSLSEQIPA